MLNKKFTHVQGGAGGVGGWFTEMRGVGPPGGSPPRPEGVQEGVLARERGIRGIAAPFYSCFT